MSDTFEKMKIYLKSGSVVVLDGVADWEVAATGGKFNSISLTQRHGSVRLIVKTLDIASVEAIIVEPKDGYAAAANSEENAA